VLECFEVVNQQVFSVLMGDAPDIKAALIYGVIAPRLIG